MYSGNHFCFNKALCLKQNRDNLRRHLKLFLFTTTFKVCIIVTIMHTLKVVLRLWIRKHHSTLMRTFKWDIMHLYCSRGYQQSISVASIVNRIPSFCITFFMHYFNFTVKFNTIVCQKNSEMWIWIVIIPCSVFWNKICRINAKIKRMTKKKVLTDLVILCPPLQSFKNGKF